MSNKTIDGVSRAALEILLSGKGGLAQAAAAHELRAQLDAPTVKPRPFGYWLTPKTCAGLAMFQRELIEDPVLTEAVVEYFHVTPLYDKPAAQPQGEPVAYMAKRKNPTGNARLDRPLLSFVGEDGWGPAFECVPLYAGQPAPVAVDAVIHGGKLDEYDAVLGALDPESVCPYLSNGEAAKLVAAVRTLQVRQITQPVPVAQKYDDVLLPFLGMMRKELHANSGKGDRDGWLGMTSGSALEEINHHRDKLWYAVATSNPEAIREHAADVANCAMMVADVCGVLK